MDDSDAATDCSALLDDYCGSMSDRNLLLVQLHDIEVEVGLDPDVNVMGHVEQCEIDSLHIDLNNAEKVAERRRGKCTAKGIDPERFRFRRRCSDAGSGRSHGEASDVFHPDDNEGSEFRQFKGRLSAVAMAYFAVRSQCRRRVRTDIFMLGTLRMSICMLSC